MRWTERQRAMLDEIGIRLWLPPAPEPSAVEARASGAPAGAPREAGPLAGEPVPAEFPMAGRAEAVGAPAGTDGAPATAAPMPVSAEDDPSRLGWAALEARAAGCTACALCAGRTRAVFGAGHPEARWMIVGDAPDADDDLEGSPFAGRPGRLLDNMLGAVGLTRSAATADRQVYVTPAVKCRPPGQRQPDPAEAAACEPFLRRQVELVRPQVIVAMGRTASQVLTGSTEPIGKLRGRLHRFGDVPVVATFHPAYLLRQPQDKADAWADLCLALETLRGAAG